MLTVGTLNWKSVILVIVAGMLLFVRGYGEKAFADSKSSKPNFIIIVADDMGFSDLGCYGGEIETPNLDALAESGLRFTQFYNAARCWPTRTSLMTGYYERTVAKKLEKGRAFQNWVPFIPHQLKSQGYRSYMSGKFHVLGADDPVAAGFDHSYFANSIGTYWSPKMLFEDGKRIPSPDAHSGYHLTDAVAEKAIGYLDEHARSHEEKPFFLYLAQMAPHWPLQAHQKDIDKYKGRYAAGWDELRTERHQRIQELGIVQGELYPMENAIDQREIDNELYGPGEIYSAVPWGDLNQEQKDFQSEKFSIHAALVDHLDRSIGSVLDKVKAMGEFDDTVIFFISDNGASSEMYSQFAHDKTLPMGSPGTYLYSGPAWSTASNTPFRRHKAHTYEGGIATPLIIHWPKGIRNPGFRSEPGHVIDLMPTLIELSGGCPLMDFRGIKIPMPIPGKSLVPTFQSDVSLNRESLFFEHLGCESLRMGDWKIVHGINSPWELYDMKNDRTETTNLAAQAPERLEKMINYFNTYKSIIDPWDQ